MKMLDIADLFCGAGGTSAGAVDAVERSGFAPRLTAINHWDRAITTHTKNHPTARHLLTSIDNVNPRDLYKPGELFLLWASPECTHHSRARGGTPVSDQSRATGHCVTRWADAVRPTHIMVENVPEFLDWGPLMRVRRLIKFKWPVQEFRTWKKKHPKHSRKDWMKKAPKKTLKAVRNVWVPDPKRKGETFKAWVALLESFGYKVDYRVLCAANYGDPTTRERLFVQAVRVGARRKIVWPDRTHAPANEITKGDLFETAMKPWVAAREIIDWKLIGRWLDEMPGKKQYDGLPLSPKTLKRILTGFFKEGLKSFIIPPQGFDGRTRSVERPMLTVTSEARGIALVDPKAFVVDIDNQTNKNGTRSVNEPLNTITTKARHGLAKPFVVEHRGATRSHIEASSKSVELPLGTVATSGKHHSLVKPVLVQTDNTGGNGSYTRSVDKPMPTVCGRNALGVVDPYLIQVAHGNDDATSDARRVSSLAEPLKTVCGNRGDLALIQPEPSLLPQQSDGRLRGVSEPCPTVATDGAIALIEPYFVKFYGTGTSASVSEPLDTVTVKDRFALVEGIIERWSEQCKTNVGADNSNRLTLDIEIAGVRYRVRFRWRMLQPHELLLTHFPKHYKLTGTKTEMVKQIGNAVPWKLARALVLAAINQNPDVSAHCE